MSLRFLIPLLCFIFTVSSSVTLAAYGGGGSKSSLGSSTKFLSRDSCPSGDYSGSYYDGLCGSNTTDDDDEPDVEEGKEKETGRTIGGYIYDDVNKNGRKDLSEKGVKGAKITLKTYEGNIVGTKETDRNGYYSFSLVPVGLYKVFVELPDSEVAGTFWSKFARLISPRVYAAETYEFTINVTEGDSEEDVIMANIAVVDGKVGGQFVSEDSVVVNDVDYEEDQEHSGATEEENDDERSAFGGGLEGYLDLIRARDQERNDTGDTSPLAGEEVKNGQNQFALPSVLPRTGSSVK